MERTALKEYWKENKNTFLDDADNFTKKDDHLFEKLKGDSAVFNNIDDHLEKLRFKLDILNEHPRKHKNLPYKESFLEMLETDKNKKINKKIKAEDIKSIHKEIIEKSIKAYDFDKNFEEELIMDTPENDITKNKERVESGSFNLRASSVLFNENDKQFQTKISNDRKNINFFLDNAYDNDEQYKAIYDNTSTQKSKQTAIEKNIKLLNHLNENIPNINREVKNFSEIMLDVKFSDNIFVAETGFIMEKLLDGNFENKAKYMDDFNRNLDRIEDQETKERITKLYINMNEGVKSQKKNISENIGLIDQFKKNVNEEKSILLQMKQINETSVSEVENNKKLSELQTEHEKILKERVKLKRVVNEPLGAAKILQESANKMAKKMTPLDLDKFQIIIDDYPLLSAESNDTTINSDMREKLEKLTEKDRFKELEEMVENDNVRRKINFDTVETSDDSILNFDNRPRSLSTPRNERTNNALSLLKNTRVSLNNIGKIKEVGKKLLLLSALMAGVVSISGPLTIGILGNKRKDLYRLTHEELNLRPFKKIKY